MRQQFRLAVLPLVRNTSKTVDCTVFFYNIFTNIKQLQSFGHTMWKSMYEYYEYTSCYRWRSRGSKSDVFFFYFFLTPSSTGSVSDNYRLSVYKVYIVNIVFVCDLWRIDFSFLFENVIALNSAPALARTVSNYKYSKCYTTGNIVKLRYYVSMIKKK